MDNINILKQVSPDKLARFANKMNTIVEASERLENKGVQLPNIPRFSDNENAPVMSDMHIQPNINGFTNNSGYREPSFDNFQPHFDTFNDEPNVDFYAEYLKTQQQTQQPQYNSAPPSFIPIDESIRMKFASGEMSRNEINKIQKQHIKSQQPVYVESYQQPVYQQPIPIQQPVYQPQILNSNPVDITNAVNKYLTENFFSKDTLRSMFKDIVDELVTEKLRQIIKSKKT